MTRRPQPLFTDPVAQHVVKLRGLLGMLEAASAPCVRAVGYEHRYCCTVHAKAGATHGDFPEGTSRCRAWPILAPASEPEKP